LLQLLHLLLPGLCPAAAAAAAACCSAAASAQMHNSSPATALTPQQARHLHSLPLLLLPLLLLQPTHLHSSAPTLELQQHLP
jgi:hypothetical protein